MALVAMFLVLMVSLNMVYGAPTENVDDQDQAEFLRSIYFAHSSSGGATKIEESTAILEID
jgi:hypothetical protein